MPTIRVDDEVYTIILDLKHRLEVCVRHTVSYNQAIKFFYAMKGE